MYKELVQYHNFNPETTRRVEDKGFPVTDEGFLELINSLSVEHLAAGWL
jgi:hypothetical protein